MRMCEAFASIGLQVTLYYIPSSVFHEDIMGYYDVHLPFILKTLPRALVPLRKSFKLEHWRAIPAFVHAFVWSHIVTALACREKADLYFVREPMLAWWLGRRGLPTVLEIHDLPRGRERTFLCWASRQRSVKLVIAMTEYLRVDLVKQFGIPAEKTVTLHDGVDLERFSSSSSQQLARQKLGLASEAPLVIYTGKLSHEKGVDTLLKAALMLADVQILIVGGGTASDTAQWQRFVDELGARNVTLVGFVPPSRIPSYLQAADVLVLPQSTKSVHATHYTSPLKLFEYMASGRPIVASRVPVLQDILTDGHNALFYTADDAVALARTIKRLMANAQLGGKLSEQACRDVQQYTWIHRAERIMQGMGLAEYTNMQE
jgi:glycosyltransferase involved in cell wall biosynthesis